MKATIIVGLVALLLFAGCDTELVESHDHNGDGVEDHTAEEHDESHNEERSDEADEMHEDEMDENTPPDEGPAE